MLVLSGSLMREMNYSWQLLNILHQTVCIIIICVSLYLLSLLIYSCWNWHGARLLWSCWRSEAICNNLCCTIPWQAGIWCCCVAKNFELQSRWCRYVALFDCLLLLHVAYMFSFQQQYQDVTISCTQRWLSSYMMHWIALTLHVLMWLYWTTAFLKIHYMLRLASLRKAVMSL